MRYGDIKILQKIWKYKTANFKVIDISVGYKN